MDYKALEIKGARYNKLYVDDGNLLNYYAGASKKMGVVVGAQETQVQILLKDYAENISKVNFNLKPSNPVEETPLLGIMNKSFESEFQENTLKLSVKACVQDRGEIAVWERGKSTTVKPSYKNKNQSVYLIDLRDHLPDSISTCHGSVNYSFQDRIPSETDYTYYSNLVDIEFPSRSLYDTAFLSIVYDTLRGKESFKIGSRLTPLHQSIRVTLKPQLNYTVTKNLGVYRKEGNSYSYLPADWKNNRVSFNTREFGEFVIRKDTLAPTIGSISVTSTSARLRIRDDLSGIAYFEANINGEWLLMVYDYKTGYIKSEKLDKSKALKGDFEFKVLDHAGNEKIYKQKIL
jgi:hypothetical protein